MFKELSPESIDFSEYFDGDMFNERSGGYEYNLFIIPYDNRRISRLNAKTYEELQEETNELYNAFQYVKDGCTDYEGNKYTYKQAMQENGLAYNPTKCSELKKLFNDCRYPDDIETLAGYLTIKTGKHWDTTSTTGYCQGDYVEILYCKEVYKNPEMYGELWLGCGKEFCFSCLDENGNVEDCSEVCGYFVADCQWKDETQLKQVLCDYEGIKPEETKLLLIDYSTMHTYTKYEYEFTEI